MRRIAHALIVLLGMLPILVAWGGLMLGAMLMLAAAWVRPDATWGNCYSFSLPLWWRTRQSSYLTFRFTRRGKLIFGWGAPLHVMCQQSLGTDAVLSQTEPVNRSEGDNLIFHALGFSFFVRYDDKREDH